MDPLSQAVVGGIAAQTVAPSQKIRLAAFAGAVAAIAADLDIFINSEADPLLFLEYHRHFTHSLIFVPLGALIATIILWAILRKYATFKMLYGWSLAGYITAAPLDACTSYGTHLLWPFSDARAAWNVISIIDPIFTLGLLVLLFLAAKKRSGNFARIGVVYAVLYLSFGAYQNSQATKALDGLIAQRNHSATRITVKPSLGNLVLWRTIYLADGDFHVDAVHVLPGLKPKWYHGASTKYVTREQSDQLAISALQRRDTERFRFFSDGYLAYHPTEENVLVDLRYSSIPSSLFPLWGIRYTTGNSSRHVEYRTYREASTERFLELWTMVRRR